MIKRLLYALDNLRIANKLILGFGMLLLLLLLMVVGNYMILQIEEDARYSLLGTQRDASLARRLSLEMQKVRSMQAEAGISFIVGGFEATTESMQIGRGYLQNALGLVEELKKEEVEYTTDALDLDEESKTILGLENSILEYQAVIDYVYETLVPQRGDLQRGAAGEVYALLSQINEDVDASLALFHLEFYVTSFRSESIQEISKSFTGLEESIKAADLTAGEETRLLNLLEETRAANIELLEMDLDLLNNYQKFEESAQAIDALLLTFVEKEEEDQLAALKRLEGARDLRRNSTPFLVAVIFLVGLGAAAVISRNIAGPVMNLTTVAHEIAEGNYGLRLQANTTNEIGLLSQSFNEMVHAIEEREAELRDQTVQLRVATAKAKEAARLKSEFLASVSHELRTPLNAIIGFTDLLLLGIAGDLTEKQKHQLERLRENGVRLLNLVNNVLDLARIEARRVEMLVNPFSPQEMAGRLQQQMMVLAEEKELEFEMAIDPRLPETLIGDEQRIEQVVVNLLSNAFKFTEAGSVMLHLRAHPAEKTWDIVVKDTGIGIPPHATDIIFEEFRQMDGSSTRAYQGSGLGLAITRNLVLIMKGRVEVQSEVGQGSTFTVTLPLVEELSDVAEQFETEI